MKEEEIEVLRERQRELENRLESKAVNSGVLNEAMEKLSEENQRLQVKVTEVEFEKASFQNRFEFQSKNLLEKSSRFGLCSGGSGD